MCDENETNKQRNKKIRRTHKNVIHGRKLFITTIPKTGENNLHELRVNNSGYNEGTICLVNGELVPRGWFFERGRTDGCH